MEENNYKNNVVKKPWGFEYLAYENDEVGIWCLNIEKDQKTSMHCHPKKTTGLILLDGIAEVSFLGDKRIIKGLDKVMIRRGLFHSTKSLSNRSLILEIETPKDKHDLVRLNDSYGRATKPYESSKFEYSKSKECLWIKEPNTTSNSYNFAQCNILIEKIDNLESFINKKDSDLLVFLRGGMVRNINSQNHLVTMPGDVGFGKIVKQVAPQLDGVFPNTTILTISKKE